MMINPQMDQIGLLDRRDSRRQFWIPEANLEENLFDLVDFSGSPNLP
jgi:hypothetical protein